jgi:uncharacterized coiled-coil DUF342 family protein
VTTNKTRPTIAVRRRTGNVTELRFGLENATPPRDDTLAAFRALITVVRKLRNQCDEYSATIESLKGERSDLYRLIDQLCAENADWRTRAYANEMAP